MGLFSLDPLFNEYAEVRQKTGPVTVEGTSTNTVIRGFSKGRVEKITGFDRNRLEIRVKVPTLKFKGNYNSKANVIGIPISGSGPYNVIFSKKILLTLCTFQYIFCEFLDNFDFTVLLNLTRVQVNGKEFFNITNTRGTFDTTEYDFNSNLIFLALSKKYFFIV